MPEPTDYIQRMIKEQEAFLKMHEPPEYMKKMLEEQGSLRKLYEPPGYVQRMIKEQEALRKMYEPPECMKKMLEEQESLRKLYETPGYVQRMIKEQEALQKMCEPPEYMKKMLEEEEKFREIFAPRGVAATALQSLLNQGCFNPLDITEKIKDLASELSVQGFYINSDGSLSFEDQNINISELSIAVSDFFEKIAADCSIENTLNRLARLKKPVQSIALWILDKIIVAFFVGVMAGLFTPNLQNFLDSRSLKSKREVTHSIKNLRHEIDLDEYKGYRVVVADSINLLQKPNMKSRVIAKLKRGKLVRVIQKNKNWTKVEIESLDPCGTRIGWVTTRYIVPLNR